MQGAPLADLFTQPVRGAAWSKSTPTTSLEPKTARVHPDLERFVAKRMNAKITELKSSHVPMLSQPQRVYEVIREAADAVQQAPQPVEEVAMPTPA